MISPRSFLRRNLDSFGEIQREKQESQAPARKGKGSKRKYDDLAKASSSGHGGGGGAAPLPASDTRAPSALADEDKNRAIRRIGDGGPINADIMEDGNDKKPLSALVQKHSDDPIIAEKIKVLSQHYAHFRIIREDSSCFYRAVIFSYLENLGQLEDRKAEATRLMEHMATSKESFCGLELDQAYFSKPELSSVMAEFNIFLKSVAEGPSSDEQFKCCLQSMKSPRIISLLRLLAEFDIRTGGEEYESFYSENFDAILYCLKNVRPMGARAKVLAIRGLTFALDIPLRVEIVDGNLTDETAEVKSFDFFPRSESGTPEEMGSCGYLLSFDCTPLLTLMYLRNPKRWYILYRKTTSVP